MQLFYVEDGKNLRIFLIVCHAIQPILIMQKLSFILFSVLLFSCKGQKKPSQLEPSSQEDTVTSFKREIPSYKDGEVDLFYTLKKQKEKQLKLDSLESGFDSLQIRIWYDYALLINRELIVIKRANGKWSAEHHEMIVDWDAYKNTETIKTNKIRSVTPKSGWDRFITELVSLKIMTLPNMDDIPGLQDNWTDGVTYNVEIATKKQYRFYSYHLPDKFEDKFPQAKNMTGILRLISIEFGQ
jgi:hypothetical protein